MSTKVRNSLSTFLEQAIILEKNNLETYSKINDAVSSNEDSISLTLTNPKDGSTSKIQIPSFGYLKNSISRLEENMKSLAGIGTGIDSRVRLSDGSYRKIITTKLPSEAPTITRVNGVTDFNFKSNWFFEDMLNPLLYVTLDLSGQISVHTERIMVERYILNCDTARKKKLFDKLYSTSSTINYTDFQYFIQQNKVHYTVDEEIKNIPPRGLRYTGTFSVIRVEE